MIGIYTQNLVAIQTTLQTMKENPEFNIINKYADVNKPSIFTIPATHFPLAAAITKVIGAYIEVDTPSTIGTMSDLERESRGRKIPKYQENARMIVETLLEAGADLNSRCVLSLFLDGSGGWDYDALFTELPEPTAERMRMPTARSEAGYIEGPARRRANLRAKFELEKRKEFIHFLINQDLNFDIKIHFERRTNSSCINRDSIPSFITIFEAIKIAGPYNCPNLMNFIEECRKNYRAYLETIRNENITLFGPDISKIVFAFLGKNFMKPAVVIVGRIVSDTPKEKKERESKIKYFAHHFPLLRQQTLQPR